MSNRRVLAVITGTIFEDVDYSLRQESSEPDLASRLVYLDHNQSGSFDSGDTFAISDDNGGFQFDNIPEGQYSVRLFDGSTTQQQVFPLDATLATTPLAVEGGQQLVRSGGNAFVLADDFVLVGDMESGTASAVSVGEPLDAMQLLPDGSVLVTRSQNAAGSAFVVSPAAEMLSVSTATKWSDIAIGGDGTGIAVPASSDPSVVLMAVDATSPTTDVLFSSTGVEVPSDAQVIASDSGNRTVFAWAGDTGLELSLWSNSTATWISESPIEISGTTQLLAFDDASGLLALRTAEGGVNVQDVDSRFATLLTLDGLSGPVAIDGARELLMTVPQDEALLQLYDLRDGSRVTEVPVDLTEIGNVNAMTLSPASSGPALLTVLGTKGVAEIALTQPAAHQITVSGDSDPQPVHFAVRLSGDNTSAPMPNILGYETLEDQTIFQSAPGLLDGLDDIEGDQLVVLPLIAASHGTTSIDPQGAFRYQPFRDYFGSDSFSVMIHDGRDVTGPVAVNIAIAPVPDAPTGIIADLVPIPENTLIHQNLGPITIVDPDINDNFNISVYDPRFEIQGGNLIFVGGDLDFETQGSIALTVYAEDTESQFWLVETVEIFLLNENEPITAIYPDDIWVYENNPESMITTVWAVDQDSGHQEHTFVVDDDRFHFKGHDLWLKPGESLNYEETPVVTVNITAMEVDGPNTLTETLQINVADVSEPIGAIALDGDSVIEFAAGAAVGLVTISGNPITDDYRVSVDDDRFEIVDSTLKLRDGTWVRRADVDEIELTIAAQDTAEQLDSASETFVIRVIENPSPFHNDDNPYDVDTGGFVSALDALVIINHLNDYGPGPIGNGNPGIGYDVNGDGMVTALDALLVINELNHLHNGGSGTVGGEQPEGESNEAESTEAESADDPVGDPVNGNDLVPVSDESMSLPVGPRNDLDNLDSDASMSVDSDSYDEISYGQDTASGDTASGDTASWDAAIIETAEEESFVDDDVTYDSDPSLRLLSDEPHAS
ncbi:dockerin type I domain-containing protein [Stieleria varia]|uniref:dockerin type I domain-containing protein n=1 Tax=Stieleria varia TaxID=2528005 RepID=UPI0018D23A5D|nr:dockerin type I domain-containing protein [Stieleria varia]